MSKWWDADKPHDSWADDPIAPASTVANLQAAYRQKTGAASDVPTPFDSSLPQTPVDNSIDRKITQFSTAAGQTGEAGLRDLNFAANLARAGFQKAVNGDDAAQQVFIDSNQAANMAEAERLKAEASQTSRPGAIAGAILSLLPTIAAGEVAVPARAAAGAGRLAQIGNAVASAAPTAALVSTEQSAANAGQRVGQGADLADVQNLYAADLPLNFAANLLPVSAPGNVVARAATGAALGAGSNAAVAATEHAIAPTVAEGPTVDSTLEGGGIGAIMAALLGGRGRVPEAEPRLTPDPTPTPPPEPLGLPADAILNAEFRAGARPVPPTSPGTVRVDAAGNAYTPQQGAQAVSDALSSIVTRPELPEPVVSVDRNGVATTSADQNAAIQAEQAGRQAIVDAAQNRRDLGITPDIERTQAARWAEQDEVVQPSQALSVQSSKSMPEELPGPRLPAAPYDMTPAEVEAHASAVEKFGRETEDSLLGDQADRWRFASRRGDVDTTDAIESQLGLTQAQRESLYGIGGHDEAFDDLKDFADAHGDAQVSSPDEAVWAMDRFMRKLGTTEGRDPADWNRDQQAAYAGMRTLGERIQAEGWDSAKIQRNAMARAASYFNDPSDAAFILNRFLKPASRKPMDASRGIRSESPSPARLGQDPSFSFAGENARTADRSELSRAQNIEAAGMDQVPDRFGNQPGSPEDTHVQTGWSRGADGKWRFEIDDSQASLRPEGEWLDAARDSNATVGQVLDHSELFDAYPQLSDVGVRIDASTKNKGGYDPSTNTIYLRDPGKYDATGADSIHSTLIHELQHVVQTEEGFARGGNSAEFVQPRVQERNKLQARVGAIDSMLRETPAGKRREALMAERSKISNQMAERGLSSDDQIKQSGFNDYQRLAGEVEARNTQSRLGMNAEERRATPPTETADTPRSQQITRFNSTPRERANREQNARSIDDLSQRLSRYIGQDVRLEPARSVPAITSKALNAFDDAFGGRTVVFDNANPDALDFQGVTFRDGVRYVNSKSDAPLLTVAGHEMTHQMRADRPDLYQELEDEIRRQGRLDKYGDNLRERARQSGEDPNSLSDDQVAEELTADAVGDALTDPEFLDRLAQRNPGLFARVTAYIRDFLDRVVSRLKSAGSSEYLSDVQAFRDRLEGVLERYGKDREQVRLAASEDREYPLAPAGERYTETSRQPVDMTPDEFLKAARPLDIDEASRDNIDDLKSHIESGRKLDPLHLTDGGEDGRHRAVAAKELGIKKIPVIDMRGEKNPMFSRRQYTPEQKTFMEKAGLAQDERSTIQKAKDSLAEIKDKAFDSIVDPVGRQTLKDNITQSTTDRLHGLKVAERGKGFTPDNSAYVAARLATGSPAILGHVLEHGGIKWADAASATGDDSVPSLMDAIKPVKDDLNEWLGWMVANRAEKLKAEGRENLMTDADIQAGKSLSKGKTPEFTEAAEDYDALRTNILDFAEKAGTINPDTRAMWDQAGHIPFYRLREDGDTAGPGTTRGLANQKKPIKQLTGGTSVLQDPLSNIVQNFSSLIDGAVKNNAALMAIKNNPDMFTKAPPQQDTAMISLAQVKQILRDRGVPDTSIKALGPDALRGMQQVMQTVPPTGDDVIRVLDKGKPTYYRVADPLMYRALTGMQDFERSLPVKALGLFKNLLTTGVTITPTFAVANLLRDAGEAYLTSGVNMIPVASSVAGAIKAMRHDPVVQNLMASGSSFHGGLYQQGSNDATARVVRQALKAKGKDEAFTTKFLKTITNPAEALRKYKGLLEAAETGSRVAVYEGMRRKGASNAEAALAAKDLLDFSKRGDSQILAFFTDTTPFLNARIQGLSRLNRVRRGENTAGTQDAQLRNTFLRRIAALTAISSLLYAWNQTQYQDGYDQLEEWDKDTYWHIAPGTKYHVRIPKPFELGLVAGTLPERILGGIKHSLGMGGDDGKTLSESFWRALTGTLEVNPPQFFVPIIEEYANKSMFTGRPIENQGDEKLLPQARSNWYTSDTAQAIGEATGTSPKRIEHLVNGYLGGLGMAGLKSADWMVRKAKGSPERPDAAMRDFPVVGRFFRGDDAPANTKQLTKFYEDSARADQVAQTIKEYLVRADERHDPSFEKKAMALAKENENILGEATVSRRAKAGIQFSRTQQNTKMQGYLTSVRDQNEAISQDTKLSTEDKRQRINANIEERNKTLLQFQRNPDQTIIPRSPKAATSIKIDPIRASMSSDD